MQLPPMPSACQGCSDRGPVLVPMTLFSGSCPGVRPPALALPRSDLRHLQLEAKQSRGQSEDWVLHKHRTRVARPKFIVLTLHLLARSFLTKKRLLS